MTWMSAICVVVMATYGRTLCWEKRNTVPKVSASFRDKAYMGEAEVGIQASSGAPYSTLLNSKEDKLEQIH